MNKSKNLLGGYHTHTPIVILPVFLNVLGGMNTSGKEFVWIPIICSMHSKHVLKSPKIVPNSHNFTLPALVLTGLAGLGLATPVMNAFYPSTHLAIFAK